MNLIFAGDPMCSWCYGFSKELSDALARLPAVRLQIRMAGIWAGSKQVLDEAGKRFRLSHWSRVEAAAGVPFNRDALLARRNFVYDTEYVSRAFVAGQYVAPAVDALRLFRSLQHAFYVEGLDTTHEAVLAGVVARELQKQGLRGSTDEVLAAMGFPEVHDTLGEHFTQVRNWGLASFPQLLHASPQDTTVVLAGFAPADVIVQTVSRLEA